MNLAQSDHLSHENARAFGALLFNEFFEHALRRERDEFSRPPRPFFLIADEFQSFMSVDVANMLDQVRKFGLFLTLAHQRFGQLDENLTDAVLTNCRIKAVFGGLPTKSARLMAEELFIGDLDPKKIKAAIWQTKFWPEYRRDKVYSHGTSHGTSTGHSSSSGESSGSAMASSSSSGVSMHFDDWFSFPNLTGERTEDTSNATSRTSSRSSSWGESSSEAETFAESDSVADIPIFFPVPFQELSSVQYYTTEEQLTELTAALKEQFPRHCFIKILGQKTQPMLVPLMITYTSFFYSSENLKWYVRLQLQRQGALPAAEIDRLIEQRSNALLQASLPRRVIDLVPTVDVVEEEIAEAPTTLEDSIPTRKRQSTIWDRSASQRKKA